MSLRFAIACVVLLLVQSSASAEELHYYVDDNGAVVITNTVSRTDARVLPGFEEARARRMESAIPASHFDAWFRAVAADYQLNPELLRAVSWVESGFDTHAVSPKGAVGLMQLMPATAKQYGVTDRTDPLQNLNAGARHLRYLLDRYQGDLSLTLAGYNAGEGNVERYDGVPPFDETRRYVARIREYLGGRTAGKMPDRAERGDPDGVRSDPADVVRRDDGTLVITNN